MLISRTMDLDLLAERMGREMSRDDARKFRPVLAAEFDGQDTRDVPDERWTQLMIEACK